MARRKFPEDRSAFVYGTPGSPVFSPNAAQFKVFADAGATTPANIVTLTNLPISNSIIVTGNDTLLPEFLGPNDDTVRELWVKSFQNGVAVGQAYVIEANFEDRLDEIEASIGGGTLTGPPGPAGTSLLNGTGAPGSGVGNNGDFYLDTATTRLYGPKAAGAWPGGYTSLIGPQGVGGAPGVAGSAGTDGHTVLNGTGAPSSGSGNNGDFYINTAAWTIYGPKSGGAWGASTSLVGAAGAAGTSGVASATLPATYNSSTHDIGVSLGTSSTSAAAGNDTRIVNAVQTTRQVISGTGLTGGGDLTADRTLAVSYGTSSTSATVGNDARLPLSGASDPEASVTATIGQIYFNTTTGVLWEKGRGSGNIGWGRISSLSGPIPTGTFMYAPHSQVSTRIFASNGEVAYTPVYFTQACTISDYGVEVTTAGGTGSVARIGIFAINNSGLPGTLIDDGGTVATVTSAAAAVVSGRSAQINTGWYFFAVAQQGAAATQATLRTVVEYPTPFNNMQSSSSVYTTSGQSALISTGGNAITGTFSSTPTAVYPTNSYNPPRIQFKVSSLP